MSTDKIQLRPVGVLRAIVLMALLASGVPAVAQGKDGANLTLRITHAKTSQGQVAVALFEGADGFPGDKTKALRTVQVAIDAATRSAQVSLAGLPYGTYAIAVFHDENRNGRLDKNILGVPKEGYGFSNGARASMGAPKFEDAKFALNQPDQTVEISLIY